MIRVRQRLYDIVSAHTGKDIATVEKDCDRNFWMDAEQAITYGVADNILEKQSEDAASEKSNAQDK